MIVTGYSPDYQVYSPDYQVWFTHTPFPKSCHASNSRGKEQNHHIWRETGSPGSRNVDPQFWNYCSCFNLIAPRFIATHYERRSYQEGQPTDLGWSSGMVSQLVCNSASTDLSDADLMNDDHIPASFR